jgi:MFS family permease
MSHTERVAPTSAAGWLARYRGVLAIPGMPATIGLGMLIKLPVIAIPIVLTLRVGIGLGDGLAAAGAVTAAWTVGMTAGAPLLGRAMDRWGLRRVLLASAVTQALFWGGAPWLGYPALVPVALVCGALLVPGSTVLRLLVAETVPVESQPSGFALDTTTTQLAYLLGPPLAAALATGVSSVAATRTLGAVLVAGTLSMALRVPLAVTRRRVVGGRGVLRPALLGTLACTAAAGIVASGFEISCVAELREAAALGWTGVVIAACGAFAIVGGVIAGGPVAAAPAWRATLLLGLSAAALSLLPHWWLLFIAVAPAAACSAATFALTATAIGRLTNADTRGWLLGLYGAALAAGNAAGAPLAGYVAGRAGPPAAFATIGTVAAATALVARHLLPRRSAGLSPRQEG